MTPREQELLSQSELGRAQLRVAAEFARTFSPDEWEASVTKVRSSRHPQGTPCWRRGKEIIYEPPAGYSEGPDRRIMRTEDVPYVEHGLRRQASVERGAEQAKKWDESIDHRTMARSASVSGVLSERKMRLTLAALGRQLIDLMPRQFGEAVRKAHRIASGLDAPTYEEYGTLAHELANGPASGMPFHQVQAAHVAAQSVSPYLTPKNIANMTFALDAAGDAFAYKARHSATPPADLGYEGEGHGHVANVLRSIVGNPHRRERIPLNRDVRALAQSIDQANNPESMPILADALEEAGASPYTVNAVRNNHGVARGHWAVDAILGKK